jgi:CheY-like chemotaxis protein
MNNVLIFPKSSRNTVLLVEDCTELRDIIEQFLLDEHPGLSVETASDGVEALDKIAEIMPSILITNINMPRMDGITLLKTLRKKGIALPTLATSGWWTRETLEKELASQGFVLNEMISFLQKPFRFEDFRRLVEKLRQNQ